MNDPQTKTGETTMSDWLEIGPLDHIPRQGSRVVQTPAGRVALFRTVDDEVYALHDHCPHKGGPLSQGIVHGRRITCPLHNWVLELAGGEAVAPDEGRAACFAVAIENGTVRLQLGKSHRVSR